MAKEKATANDKKRIEQQVYDVAKPLATALCCELLRVEFVFEAGYWYLRLYIDRPEPVDHDCCEKLSRQLSVVLDSIDPIKQSYFLEISSPGI
ncbi:MAG: hypothetical protein FWG43_00395 [Clostridiales bacterium]|nr:hypothetical protein [Clostridiales bacterium]